MRVWSSRASAEPATGGGAQNLRTSSAAIQHEIDHPHFAFTGGTRHSTGVDYHAFRRDLGRELKKAGLDIGKPPQGIKSRYKQAV